MDSTPLGIITSPMHAVFPVTTFKLILKEPLEPTPVQGTIVAPFAITGVILKLNIKVEVSVTENSFFEKLSFNLLSQS